MAFSGGIQTHDTPLLGERSVYMYLYKEMCMYMYVTYHIGKSQPIILGCSQTPPPLSEYTQPGMFAVACSTVHAYGMFSCALIVQLLGGAYGVQNVEATPRRKMSKNYTSPLSGDATTEWNVVGWISTPIAR